MGQLNNRGNCVEDGWLWISGAHFVAVCYVSELSEEFSGEALDRLSFGAMETRKTESERNRETHLCKIFEEYCFFLNVMWRRMLESNKCCKYFFFSKKEKCNLWLRPFYIWTIMSHLPGSVKISLLLSTEDFFQPILHVKKLQSIDDGSRTVLQLQFIYEMTDI